MKCPFLKKSIYEAHGMTGNGYPVEWVEYPKFEDCIGEECAAFATSEPLGFKENGEAHIVSWCNLCQSALSADFI